jgi:DNA-binding PadR family transcriptional regulator
MRRTRDETPARLTQREESILLLVLSEKRYGLEILDALGLVEQMPLGSLYVTLQRMERKGLIESAWEENTDPRRAARRRYYWATPTGVDAVRRAESVRDALSRVRA